MTFPSSSTYPGPVLFPGDGHVPIPNYPTIVVQVEFVSGTWTTLPYIPQASGGRGRSYELATLQAGTMRITVDCSDGALDPTNTTSPYYPNVKLNKRARVTVTWAGVTKAIFTGYVERYPQRWEFNGQYQFTDMVIVDVPANLSQNILESAYTEAVKALHPSVWYPLSDASGSAGTAVAGERAAGLPPGVFFTPGGNPTTATLGSTSSAAVGEEGQTVADFKAPPANPNVANGTLLNLPPSATLPSSGPWTILFNFTAKVGGGTGDFLSIGNLNGGQIPKGYIVLSTNNNNAVYFQVAGDGVVPGISQNIFFGVEDGLPHTFALTLAADNNTFRLLYDGTTLYTFTYGGVYAPPGGVISIGGEYRPNTSETVGNYTGTISNFCLFNSELVTAAAPYGPAGALAQVYFQGFAGDTTRGRFSRVARFAGVTAINSTADGNSMLQHAQLRGKTVLTALQNTATMENGSLFVDGDGILWFVNRRNRNNRASTATFADTGSGYPYLGLTTDYDATHVVNDVTLARDNGVTAHVINQSSIDSYGRHTQSKTTEIQDDYQTVDAANYILGTYAEPVRRISSIELNPGTNPALWPMVTSLDLNQAVTVVRTPGMGHSFTQVCWVEQIKYNMDASTGSFTMTLQLSPANSHPVLRLDDPVYGRLDAGNALTY